MSSVKRVLSPEDWRNRQINTLKSVGRANYLEGIKSPKDDPIAAGIRAQGRYEDQMKKDEVLKRRKSELEKTTMSEWYALTASIGPDKLVDGVVKREAKVSKFITAYQPLLTTHLGKIDGMANVSDSDREQRVLENLRGLKALKGKA